MKKSIELNNIYILMTGGAGFTGGNLILRILEDYYGVTAVNIDNLNNYYEPSLKT